MARDPNQYYDISPLGVWLARLLLILILFELIYGVVAVIDFGSKKMTWAALGDVDGIVHRTEAGSSGSTGILQKGGTLGLHYPGVHLQPQNLSDGCMIVLTSDGVSRRYREMRPMGLRPCDFAPACLEQFGRDNDDRTVLAVSFREGAA